MQGPQDTSQRSGLTTARLCGIEVNAGNSQAGPDDAWADSRQTCNMDESQLSAWQSSKIWVTGNSSRGSRSKAQRKVED